MNCTEWEGTKRLAPKAVRCWVKHTAFFGVAPSKGAIPSVFQRASSVLKYWHRELYKPRVTSTGDHTKWLVMFK